MIDFSPIWAQQSKISTIAAELTPADLRNLANESVDTILEMITPCGDVDVVFIPHDPQAEDQSQHDNGWTLGHVIVHATASSEERAVLAAELARGVEREGRSRFETPWESVTTIAQVRSRLEESRRMRLASLDMWPDEPHYEVTSEISFLHDTVDARGQFLIGLLHETAHYEQIRETVGQALAQHKRGV